MKRAVMIFSILLLSACSDPDRVIVELESEGEWSPVLEVYGYENNIQKSIWLMRGLQEKEKGTGVPVNRYHLLWDGDVMVLEPGKLDQPKPLTDEEIDKAIDNLDLN